MSYLIAGLIVFFGIHVFPWFPARRDAAIAKLGRQRYRGLFALTSAIGLGLIIYGYGNADRTFLWAAPEGARHLAYAVVPVALCLAVAAEIRSNIKRLTAHPMLWGVALWAAVHLLNNGDVESLLLFGGFMAYSVLAMLSANLRGAQKMQEKQPLWRDIVALAGGIAATGAIAHFHETLFGVSIL
ncbi:MAG: NnrU family protein [Rhodospirillales bacterium]|nr:NnrU family protein [Rhodospirillales bacterium]